MTKLFEFLPPTYFIPIIGVLCASNDGVDITTGSLEVLRSYIHTAPLSHPAITFSDENGEKIAVFTID